MKWLYKATSFLVALVVAVAASAAVANASDSLTSRDGEFFHDCYTCGYVITPGGEQLPGEAIPEVCVDVSDVQGYFGKTLCIELQDIGECLLQGNLCMGTGFDDFDAAGTWTSDEDVLPSHVREIEGVPGYRVGLGCKGDILAREYDADLARQARSVTSAFKL